MGLPRPCAATGSGLPDQAQDKDDLPEGLRSHPAPVPTLGQGCSAGVGRTPLSLQAGTKGLSGSPCLPGALPQAAPTRAGSPGPQHPACSAHPALSQGPLSCSMTRVLPSRPCPLLSTPGCSRVPASRHHWAETHNMSCGVGWTWEEAQAGGSAWGSPPGPPRHHLPSTSHEGPPLFPCIPTLSAAKAHPFQGKSGSNLGLDTSPRAASSELS